MDRIHWVCTMALLTACGGGGGGGNGTSTGTTTAEATGFDSFITVDDLGVAPTGDFTGLPTGDSWDTIDWWVDDLPPGPEVAVTAVVEDFQEEDLTVPEATVSLWYDNVVDDSIDLQLTSSVSGVVEFVAPSCAPMAYKVNTDPLLNPTQITYKAHHFYPPYDIADGLFISVSEDTYQLIPALLGVQVLDGMAVIAGTAYDAVRDAGLSSDVDDGKIEGVQVVVYDENGQIPDTLSVNYFVDAFPNRDQQYTSEDGLWVAANVPPGNLRVEMWGVLDGELRLLGATLLFSEADSINIANIYAGYGDGVKYPDDCHGTTSTGTTTGGTTTGGTTTGGTTTGGTTTGGTTTGSTTGTTTGTP